MIKSDIITWKYIYRKNYVYSFLELYVNGQGTNYIIYIENPLKSYNRSLDLHVDIPLKKYKMINKFYKENGNV